MKRILIFILVLVLAFGAFAGCKKKPEEPTEPTVPTMPELPQQEELKPPVIDVPGNVSLEDLNLNVQNLLRSIQMFNELQFQYLNYAQYKDGHAALYASVPLSGKNTSGYTSVWGYTSVIEALNNIIAGIDVVLDTAESKDKDADPVFKKLRDYYVDLYDFLFEELAHYRNTSVVEGFNGARVHTGYSVDRSVMHDGAPALQPGSVYDDQMWLIRELIDGYKLTGKADYLADAERMTAMCLDGWDQSFKNRDGAVEFTGSNEELIDAVLNGDYLYDGRFAGFPWGPPHATKHACSNGPMISPLVWLYEIYKDSNETIKYHVLIAPEKTREVTFKKSDLYLKFAQMTYKFMMDELRTAEGVFADMLDGGGKMYELKTADEVRYKQTTSQGGHSGAPLSYNAGSPLSGAVDLARVTPDGADKTQLIKDIISLSDSSFSYFSKESGVDGLYSFKVNSEFDGWFFTVLFRAWVEALEFYPGAEKYAQAVQDYLNYGYDNHYYNGVMPRDLIGGWVKGYNYDEKKGVLDSFGMVANFGAMFELDQYKLTLA